jgi:hypothetical protein
MPARSERPAEHRAILVLGRKAINLIQFSNQVVDLRKGAPSK